MPSTYFGWMSFFMILASPVDPVACRNFFYDRTCFAKRL
jgi:hypothetical protein